MKEQRNKNTINKIVYFALTSAAETPWGRDYGNRALSLPFPSFCLFFCFLSAPPCSVHSSLMKLWEFRGKHRGWDIDRAQSTMGRANFGSSEGRAGKRCLHVCVRAVLAVCAYTQECCHTRLIKISKVRNVKLMLFTGMLPHARSLPCDLNANQHVCLAKNTEACQTSGGPAKPMTQSFLKRMLPR